MKSLALLALALLSTQARADFNDWRQVRVTCGQESQVIEFVISSDLKYDYPDGSFISQVPDPDSGQRYLILTDLDSKVISEGVQVKMRRKPNQFYPRLVARAVVQVSSLKPGVHNARVTAIVENSNIGDLTMTGLRCRAEVTA